MKKVISIVSPCYNEEDSIVECYETVRNLFEEQLPEYDREHIFCDNASTDRTVELLKEAAGSDEAIKIIVNSRNFGIFKNTFNGVLNATGDAVVLCLPIDLQDPPELIPEFVKHWESGYEVVYGMRGVREENALLALARKAYYRLLSKLTYVDYPPDAGDFQLVDRCVLDAMKQMDDAQPFMRLMTFDCGFRAKGIRYTWRARKHGSSRNPILHLFDQGLNGIINYSGAPIRLALIFGALVSFLSVTYAIVMIVLVLFNLVESPRGMATVIVGLFFFGGVQLFFLGVIGEYLMAVFNQVRRRPLVVERERINF